MTSRAAAVAAVAVAAVLQACGGPADVPDSPAFTDCLRAAGIDPDRLDDEDGRADALSEPAALQCVVDELDAEGRRDALAEVLTTEELTDALLAWVRASGAGPEVEAREAGSLLGAGGDPEDPRVSGGQLDENLAWEVYVDAHGEPPAHQRWLADDQAQRTVSQGDPYAPASQFLDWLEGHGGDSREQALAQEVRALQDEVATAREDAATG